VEAQAAEAIRVREERENRVAALATERLMAEEQAHHAFEQRQEAERGLATTVEHRKQTEAALARLHPRRWRLAAAMILAVIAAGSAIYGVMRAPQTASIAAYEGPLTLRLEYVIAVKDRAAAMQ
jgi:hypothetical protein